jgi:hypothetical protein
MIMVRAIDPIEDVLEYITSDLWQKKHELRRLTDGEFDPVLVFEVERVIALLASPPTWPTTPYTPVVDSGGKDPSPSPRSSTSKSITSEVTRCAGCAWNG